MRGRQLTIAMAVATAVAASGLSAAGSAGAASAQTSTPWVEVQAGEVPASAPLGVRSIVRRAMGSVPAPPTGISLDGPIWVNGPNGRLLVDPATGASRAAPIGGVEISLGPGGDRAAHSTARFESTDQEPPMLRFVTYHVTHEDGTFDHAFSFGHSIDTGTPNDQSETAWSPHGEAVLAPTSWLRSDAAVRSLPITGGSVTHSPLDGLLSDPVVSPRGRVVVGGGAVYLPTSLPTFGQGKPVTGPMASLGLEAFGASRPQVGLEPGGAVSDRDSTTYLAFLGTPDGQDQQVFVDHADGRGPVSVAHVSSDARCRSGGLALSPSRRQLAYVKPVVSGGSCIRSQIRVLTVGSNGRFDAASGASDRLVTELPGSFYEELDWQAMTPAAAKARLAGRNRVGTAVATSHAFFPDHTASVAVIAGREAFPDALAGSALAGEFGGPVLLTAADTLEASVAQELARALKGGGTVYVVGGDGAVSQGVEDALRSAGHAVERLGGTDRYETAVRVAREMDRRRGTPATSAFVATGSDFPDALVAGPAAVSRHAPVVLTSAAALPPITRAYLDELTSRQGHVYAVGGPAIAPTDDYPNRTVLSGSDRYETAAVVAGRAGLAPHFFLGPQSVVGLADGRNWPDAVTGGAAMGGIGMPVLLVNGTSLPTPTRERIRFVRSSADAVIAFGGTAAVADAPLSLAVAVAGRQTLYYGPNMP